MIYIDLNKHKYDRNTGILIKEKKGDIKMDDSNYIFNLAINNKSEDDFLDVLNIIPNPLITESDKEKSDVLSVIFYNFFKNTEIPIALPVFSFLSFLSAFCVKNNITCRIPKTISDTYLDTWVTVLAPSGSAKTMSNSLISKVIPKNINDEKVIENNFLKPSGPAKFIEDLAGLPETIDGDHQWGFWTEDEVAQMFKRIENVGHPMSELREFLLKIHNHDKLVRRTKLEEVETKKLLMTLYFINTFESFADTISIESVTDGLIRRLNIIIANKDERSHTTYALYDFDKILDTTLANKMEELFFSMDANTNFTFSKDCVEAYETYYKLYWDKRYYKILPDKENFYRTYMMESWKYAIFHHLIMHKSGTEVQKDSLAWGMRISLLFADSMKTFMDRKIKQKDVDRMKVKADKYYDYLIENPEITMRDFTRKFNMKKEQALLILEGFKNSGHIKNHILFKQLK